MEKEGNSAISSTDASKANSGSENLVLSPHRSRRLEEKAKALNKCRLSLKDLLCNVDKRNEKFGFVVTDIGFLKSDYSSSKTYSSVGRDTKAGKKGLINIIGSSDLECCDSVSNDQKVFSPGENSSYVGDLHGRKCTDYSEITLASRVARQNNLKTEFLQRDVREKSSPRKNRKPTLNKLHSSKSCANLSEVRHLDADNKNSFVSATCDGSSKRTDSDIVSHPIKIITASSTSSVSSDTQVKDHSSKELSNQSSVSRPETTTMHETTDNKNEGPSVIVEGNSLPSCHHENQASILPFVSSIESESANVSVVENKTNPESSQESSLFLEKNKSDGEASNSDNIMIIEEKNTRASQETDVINPSKISLRNSKDFSIIMKDEESSATWLTKESLDKMTEQTISHEEGKTDHSEQAPIDSDYILVSPSSSECYSKSSLSHSSKLARHIKLDRSGVAVIDVVSSDFPSWKSTLSQPKEESVTSTVKATVVDEIGHVSAVSSNDSMCNDSSKEVLDTAAEKCIKDEKGKPSVGKIIVTEEGNETTISTPKSVKEEQPSPESPEIICLEMLSCSRDDSSTNSTSIQKHSTGKSNNRHSENSIANVAVRNLFTAVERSNNLNVITSESKIVQQVVQKNPSICDVDQSNEALKVVEKSAVKELKGYSHLSPKKLKTSKSSETAEKVTSDSKFINGTEKNSLASPKHRNNEIFVFDVDEDLEKCEDDVLSRHQKGDYSFGFTGFKDNSQTSCSRKQPTVVLERLPSWIVMQQRVKLTSEISPLKETVQELIDIRISEEELLNRKEELQFKRKYKSMSDLSELIHNDLQKEKEAMAARRRVTRSFGEEIKIDYMARLPDERDIKLKKSENDEPLTFLGFNIPFGYLGLPDHYLIYRRIINMSKQLGFHIDPNLGAGNLDEKSESLYFMGDCNPFSSRPKISQVEREKISPTKILEIASVNRNIHCQHSMSPQRLNSESHDAFLHVSSEKVQELEDLTVEFEEGPSLSNIHISEKQFSSQSPSKHSYLAVDLTLQNSEYDTDLNYRNYDINSKPTGNEGSTCGKSFCHLGCVCESLEVRERIKEHCGHEGCMFSSSCCRNSSKPSTNRAKMSILEHIDVASSEEMIQSKRKRKPPARLLQEEIIFSPLTAGAKKQCHNSKVLSLNEEKSKIVECSVALNRFHLSGANVRCLYHFKQNCPCLKDKSLERPKNVALKSTSGRLTLNPRIKVAPSKIYPDGFDFQALGPGQSFTSPEGAALNSSSDISVIDQYRSTIIYPQTHSRVRGSNSFSNGMIDSADSLVMREDLHRGGTLRYFFNNMAEFQHTLSQGKMKCSDLEKICSKSLTYLPKGAVQIMKLSLLKEMLQNQLAFLWVMCLPYNRAHIFLSKENKAPGVSCQRVRDLDGLNKFPSHVGSFFCSSEKDSDHLISCIQISHSYFWQVTGTISFIKNTTRNTSKTGTVVTNITNSRPMWSASTQKKIIAKGFNPINVISLGSGNKNAINSLCNSKKLKANHPKVNLFSHSQLAHVATKVQPSVSSAKHEPLVNYRVWYNLDLNNAFDELRVDSKNFRITRLKLLQLFYLARYRKSFVKVSFNHTKTHQREPLPGILVYPNEKNNLVKIGPFPMNEKTGVKTYKKINGEFIQTNSFLTIGRVVVTGRKLQSQHDLKGRIPKTVETNGRENFEEKTQYVRKASEITKMINPKVSEIVSTKDADPGLKIVIQDVQGHYDTFNDIPSPRKSSVPLEGDTSETWASGSTVSYDEEYNFNESEISQEVISVARPTETVLSSLHSLTESSTSLESGGTGVKDYNYNQPDSNTSSAADSEELPAEDNLSSNDFYNPNEIMLNHEFIVKEEPSDPLDEYDCDPLANSPEVILPDPIETSDQCDWSGAKDLEEIVVENSSVLYSSPSSVQKKVKKKSSVLQEVKQRSSFISKRSLLKKNALSPKARKLPNSFAEEIKTNGNIETGYLIPDVPGIQPIPVARGGMTELESKAITMKNPMSKDGKLVHFLDLGLANLFLNETILQKVNFFPNNMKINWSFVRVDGMASKDNFDGLMNLGELTKNMFITPKGVFSYDEEIKTKCALQRCGIGTESLHRFMEARRRRQIINIQKNLANLIQTGKKENTLIATICHARKEIEKLKAECTELEDQIYHERCIRTSLMSRLRDMASDKEREGVMALLKRKSDTMQSELIEEDAEDNWRLGDSSGNFAPLQDKGRKTRTRKRPSLGNEDKDWNPRGCKRNKRVRQAEVDGRNSKKVLSAVKNKPQLKPHASTAFGIKFQRQLNMLKKHIISRNSYRSKGVESSTKTCKYSILNNAKSVLAAADAKTNSSPIENEESILSSGSDVDIGTLEDGFEAY